MMRFLKILVLTVITQPLISQMQVDWQQCYCSMETDMANDIVHQNDGFLVMGMQLGGDAQVTCSNTSGAWLLRISDEGDIIWQKCFSDKGAYLMFREYNGSEIFVVGAAAMEPYPNETNLWVAKVDSLGEIVWDRALGNDDGVSSYHFYGIPTNDGGVIASVLIFSQGGDVTTWYGGYDGWAIKLDSLGNTDWNFTMGSQMSEGTIGIVQTNDNGYLVLGSGSPDGVTGNITSPSYTSSWNDAILYKLDSEGNPEWNKTYGGSESDIAVRAVSLEDGYLIAGGATSDDGYCEGSGWHEGYFHTGDRTPDIWLIRTDLGGEIIWQKCYGGSQNEGVSRVFSTSDGGFVVFGTTSSHDGDISYNPANGNDKSIWIFKINAMGDLIWEQCIGGGASEYVHGVIQHSDHNYTLAGEMFYSPSGDVNCSNFIYGSRYNYWVLGISDTTVGTNSPAIENSYINIYPNPASSILNIQGGLKIGSEVNVEVYDIFGRLVFNSEFINNGNIFSINTSRWQKGLYFVRVSDDKNFSEIKKIVVEGQAQ